jgi:transcriptional regulator with XRE-family HTH domain
MLGKELRRARERARLTQEELAFADGVDRSYISQLENDRRSPTLELLFRLCKAMDVQVWRIIRRVEETGNPEA